jgi:hypothetical protein
LGIYACFWWYFINAEMRDLGRSRKAEGLGDSPGLSTVAYVLGGSLIIPAIWTLVTTCQRIRRSQTVVGVSDRLNGWIVVVLAIFTLGIGVHVYMQSELNKVWRSDEVQAQATDPFPGNSQSVGSGGRDDLENLKRLAELRDSGALTTEEYEAQKSRILERLG